VSFAATQDGFCRLLLWNHKAVTNISFTRGQRGNECVITKLSQLTPYIVANKGALVSGGAFQFDDDGNGYTMNYPPIGEEWVVGKWIDGKPIYKRTFEQRFSTPGVDTAVMLSTTGDAKHIVRYEVVFYWDTIPDSDQGDWSSSDNKYHISSDPARQAFILEVTTAQHNIRLMRNILDERYLNVTHYITVWYTKTTD
jgi:hypothetical protein